MYSGYYCKKCKIIPIIKAQILNDDSNISFYVKCKCNTHNLSPEKLNKYYYFNNIYKKDIINEDIFENTQTDDNLLLKMEENNEIKKYNLNLLDWMKDKYIEHIKYKIKLINNLIKKTKNEIEKYLKTIEILTNSYKYINSNYSNINNIKNNINHDIYKINTNEKFFDFKTNLNDIKYYIKKIFPVVEYEQQLKTYIKKEKNYKLDIYDFFPSKILKISNELLLINEGNYLKFLSINDFNVIGQIKISYLPHNKNKNFFDFDIDEEKNILCVIDKSVKIFQVINNEQFKFLGDDKIIDIEPIIYLDVSEDYKSILFYKDENDKLFKNKFICYNKQELYFYQYDLNKKLISMFHNYKYEVYKIQFVDYNNKKILAIFTELNLLLLDLSNFTILGKFNIESSIYDTINLLNINKNELLVTNDFEIYILNLNNFKIKLKVKYDDCIYHTFLLEDKTIIICSEKWAKRYNQKNLELINYFYKNNFEYYDYDISYDYIINSLEISDKERIFVFKKGEYELNSMKFK